MIRCCVVTLVGLAVLALLPSCAPKRAEIRLDTSAIGTEQLITLVKEQSGRVRTLEGRGMVTFESPDLGGSASFDLSLKKPDSLLVFFEGPLGIDVGTLFMSREKYLVYNPMDNVVITGTPKRGFIRSLIPFDLSFEEILNAFSGSFDIPQNAGSVRTYRVDDDRFLISLACGSRMCSYWIDNETLRVTRFEVHEEKGRLLMQATTSSFMVDGDASAPRRITLWFPGEERQVSVHYSSLTINPEDPSFAYSVPRGARTIHR